VLIIIGLLLAAVVKGKDLIRSAELKKFYNGFIKQWELTFNNYYDRTGKVLGGPLIISESSENATFDGYVGGDIISVSDTDLIIRDPKRFKTADDKSTSPNNGYYSNAIIAAGLTLPKPVRGYSNIFDITATEVGRASVIVTFGTDPAANSESLTFYQYANTIETSGAANNTGNVITNSATKTTLTGHGDGKGNFMLIINLPYDVAPQIDKIVDEKTDPSDGTLVCIDSYSTEKKIGFTTLPFSASNIKDISNATDCGGPLGWGNSTNKYVTALYKLEF
jgi:hypothetical protein